MRQTLFCKYFLSEIFTSNPKKFIVKKLFMLSLQYFRGVFLSDYRQLLVLWFHPIIILKAQSLQPKSDNYAIFDNSDTPGLKSSALIFKHFELNFFPIFYGSHAKTLRYFEKYYKIWERFWIVLFVKCVIQNFQIYPFKKL